MINNYSILALVPARGGSKGIPRKNVINLGGKPLILHTLEQANKSKYVDRVILSSDDDEIISVAKAAGCDVPFVRPAHLATDEATTLDVILHAIQEIKGYDYIVLLQTTSPFRTTQDIDSCIEKCISNDVTSCVSVTETDKSPYWMYTINDEDVMSPLMGEATYSRRQDTPVVYALNGAVYVIKCSKIKKAAPLIDKKTISHVMPKERSVDIDTMLDLKVAEMLLTECN